MTESADLLLLLDRVGESIREVGATEVMPRFRSLQHGDIEEKSPGDYVTVADHACEVALEVRLRAILDVPVVGEEAATRDPGLLGLVDRAPATWIVDPIDGTANFVAGSTDFAVMVALAEFGEAVAGWIWHPISDRLVSAARGVGVFDDGTPRTLSAPEHARSGSGVLKHKYVAPEHRAAVAAVADELELAPDRGCAGLEYLDVLDGRSSFLFYWRTRPWDHAPGGAITAEAGACVARLDGEPYRPGDGRRGLLTARPELWDGIGPRLDAATT